MIRVICFVCLMWDDILAGLAAVCAPTARSEPSDVSLRHSHIMGGLLAIAIAPPPPLHCNSTTVVTTAGAIVSSQTLSGSSNNRESKAARMYNALGRAWGKRILRHGERAQMLNKKLMRRTSRNRIKRPRKNKYDYTSSIHMAYRCIGNNETNQKPGEIGKSTRHTDMIAVHGYTLRHSLKCSASAVFQPTGGGTVIDCQYDATPLLMTFGMLAAAICPYARYVIRDTSPDARKT